MTSPGRIRLSRAKGWRLPPNTVVVSRPSKWGNPFVMGRDGTRRECVDLLRLLATGKICLTRTATGDAQIAWLRHVRQNIRRLRGKNLACWCPLDQPCHADILLEIANQQQQSPQNKRPKPSERE